MELMVTCVIGGIVIAATVPNLRSYQESQRLSRASETIATACMEARAKARAQNHSVIVEYRRDVGEVAVIDDVNNDGVVDVGERTVVRSLGAGITLANTTSRRHLVFDSRGAAMTGAASSSAVRRNVAQTHSRLRWHGYVSIRGVESTDSE